MRRSTTLVATAALAVALGLVLAPLASATNLEDVTVVPATGADALPAGATDGPWTTIAGPVIEFTPYSNPDVLPEGTVFSFSLPDGYEWDAAAVALPTVEPSPGMPAGLCELVPGALQYADGVLTMPLSGRHDIGCRISFSALRIRALAGTSSGGGDLAVTWMVPGLGTGSAPGGAVAVLPVVAPPADDVTPLITPAPQPEAQAGNDLVLIALGALLVVAIGWTIVYIRRRGGAAA